MTKIFLDSGDPKETEEAIKLLGVLDGQTTNPTLIARNPEAQERLEKGKKFAKEEVYKFYRQVVEEISKLIPKGSVSVEVYADEKTTVEEMLKQAKEMSSWIPNAHIKFPITKAGLEAAGKGVKEGIRPNMTLCFAQEQAAAVYSVTKGAKRGDVFVSPFVGRLDDKGENGMDLIKNILKMYQDGDGHAEVLAASVRSLDHLMTCLKLEADIVTVPLNILQEWADKDFEIPGSDFVYKPEGLAPIKYMELDINQKWQELDIKHELTDVGIERFTADWNALI